jgi:hypothetical protein
MFGAMLAGLLLTLTLTSPAYGQIVYSDMWADDTDAENGNLYIVGSGVTEDSYNSYGHEYSATMTLSGPNGSQVTQAAEGRGLYVTARAEDALLWDPDFPGSFFIVSSHVTYCPIYSMGGWESFSYVQGDFSADGENTLYYKEDGLLTPNTCAYHLCPWEEDKYCYTRSRGSQTHARKPSSEPGDGPCYTFLAVTYLLVPIPYTTSYVCVRAIKLATEDIPTLCAY